MSYRGSSCSSGKDKGGRRIARIILDTAGLEIPVEKRRTFMISEQNNFIWIARALSKKMPKKKYRALAPDEYTKFVIFIDKRYNELPQV